MKQEEIRHAAVKTESGWIFIGKCHADCFEKFFNLSLKVQKPSSAAQGFVTNLGRFVDRHEAGKIAIAAGQVSKDRLIYFEQNCVLFSEDLWSPEFHGIMKYCEIRGYHA